MHNAKRPIYDFRDEIKALGIEIPNNKIPKIDIRLNSDELKKGAEDVFEITGNTKKPFAFLLTQLMKRFTQKNGGMLFMKF